MQIILKNPINNTDMEVVAENETNPISPVLTALLQNHITTGEHWQEKCSLFIDPWEAM